MKPVSIRRSGLQGNNQASGGFTLLEVLLAFVIFALSFATVLEILSSSMRSTQRARQYSEAALVAQSLMDSVGTEIPLMESFLDGETGHGISWTIDITYYMPDGDNSYLLDLALNNGTALFWVDIKLEWGSEARRREATFTTIKSVLEGVQ